MKTYKLFSKKIILILLACILVLSSLCACGPLEDKSSDVTEVGYTFTDALGREVTVDKPKRVVALMQSFAEVWLLAGGGDCLVGVTDDAAQDMSLELSDSVTVVGSFRQPNVETIMSLNPDLVILSAEQTGTDSHVALRDTLEATGITAAYFSVTHFPDYVDMLKICTDITGDSEAYHKNGKEVENKVKQVIAKKKLENSPSVLFCITYSGGVRPQSSETMTGKMLCELGCHNILDDYPGLLQDFSMEKILELDPDYIFVVPMGNSNEAAQKALEDSLEAYPAWTSLSAVKSGRYFILPQDMFLYKPNAHWADSYEYLAECLDG